MNSVGKEIKCTPTLRLIEKMLTCGSLDTLSKKIKRSDVGTPQGNVASPTLANIVLDEFDKFMSRYKDRFEIGKWRMLNKEYISLINRRRYTRDLAEKKRI